VGWSPIAVVVVTLAPGLASYVAGLPMRGPVWIVIASAFRGALGAGYVPAFRAVSAGG